jgi:ATPase subunit of ABC transporter with duplicated ATPase domains
MCRSQTVSLVHFGRTSPVHIGRSRPVQLGRTSLVHYRTAGDISVGRLSFGERSRLALALLAVRGCNFLLLDEPINHLDIPSRESFERAMARFEGTVLAVVHDRYFIDRLATTLWLMEGGRVRAVMVAGEEESG